MKSASGPLIGRLAARKRRITPGPASNKRTVPSTTTAVAGPDAAGSGYGVPVPRRITLVVVAFKSEGDVFMLWTKAGQPSPNDKSIAKAVCMRLLLPLGFLANSEAP